MNIQQLDTEILNAKETLKKLRQYKRLLLKIEAEKAAIAALESGETVNPETQPTPAPEPIEDAPQPTMTEC